MSIITMQTDSLSLVLNGQAIVDFAEGDFAELNYLNQLTSRVNSSEGGVNINKRIDAGVADLIIRVQKFSHSDIFFNSASNQDAPVVFNGSIKEDFLRDGSNAAESFVLENGTITTRPNNVKNNTDGNAMIEYTIQFRNATRNI